MNRKPEDLYVYTDRATGNTVVATQQVIPWDDLDETLKVKYPHLFPDEEAETGEEEVA